MNSLTVALYALIASAATAGETSEPVCSIDDVAPAIHIQSGDRSFDALEIIVEAVGDYSLAPDLIFEITVLQEGGDFYTEMAMQSSERTYRLDLRFLPVDRPKQFMSTLHVSVRGIDAMDGQVESNQLTWFLAYDSDHPHLYSEEEMRSFDNRGALSREAIAAQQEILAAIASGDIIAVDSELLDEDVEVDYEFVMSHVRPGIASVDSTTEGDQE